MNGQLLQPATPARQAAMQLVCLPYAGGGAAAYYRWRSSVPPEIELVPFCPPGREGRAGEPPCTDMKSMIADLMNTLLPGVDRPWAVLGHSMGAWLGLELVREVRRRGAAMPLLLAVAASGAPQAGPLSESLSELPDDEFVRQIEQRYAGIPPAVRDNAELLKLLLPILRGDVKLIESYACEEQPPLDVEIMALGGTNDPATSIAGLAAWRRCTSGKFSLRMVPGGHFFLLRDRDIDAEDNRTGERVPTALRLVFEKCLSLLSGSAAVAPRSAGDAR